MCDALVVTKEHRRLLGVSGLVVLYNQAVNLFFRPPCLGVPASGVNVLHELNLN
jgi:hypothetical protein